MFDRRDPLEKFLDRTKNKLTDLRKINVTANSNFNDIIEDSH